MPFLPKHKHTHLERGGLVLRTALYTRVSTEMQADEGFSLDAQLTRLHAYCESQGWTVADIYTDEGLSAKNTGRPELQRMLRDIAEKKIDIVLVYKLDRLTRNVTDLYELIQKFETRGVGFKSATEVFDTTTAMGRLFITIVAALAQWERENLAERTKMGQIEMTKQGKWSGGNAAFGYRYVDGNLVIEEAEAAVVQEIFNRYLSGQGTRQMLHWLNNPNHSQLAPHQRWTQTAIKYVLRNPLYAGYVRYGYRTVGGKRQKNPLVMPGTHEPVIKPEMFERVEQMRAQRTKMPSRSGTGTYALSGVLYCGLCGSSMSGRTNSRSTKKGTMEHRYYVCVERLHSKLCEMPYLKEDTVQSLVLDELERYYTDLSMQADLSDLMEQDQSVQERNALEAELRKSGMRRKRWMDAYEDGAITSVELRERLDQISEREQKHQENLEHMDSVSKPDLNLALIQSVLHTFRDTWQQVDAPEQKELLRLLVKRIDIYPDKSLRVSYHM